MSPLFFKKKLTQFIWFCLLSYLPCLCFAGSPIDAGKTDTSLKPSGSISSNPAAVNILTGSGLAQAYFEKKLGIKNNHGIRIGGFITGDTNYLITGGVPHPQRLTSNGLFLLGVSVETEKLIGWRGGLFDVEFLQFNGQKTNKQAGSVQGYNSLPGAPPLDRSELYKLWFRQEFFNKTLYVRIGKTVPSMDFDNVSKPIPLDEKQLFIPAVSGLIYTPLFVNASMLGVMPGYYNSAYGITINFVPIRQWYLSYGVYDGNLARGKQTGLSGPTFNGSYFHIGEMGFSWFLGPNKMPGDIGFGFWHQTGLIKSSPMLTEHSTSGYYVFGTQRLWYKNPFINNSGISAFYQYGKNYSHVLSMPEYVGAGLTGFALIPRRENDSMGFGVALSWLNQRIFSRRTEVMYQGYYQMQLFNFLYFEPALTYIPRPGAAPNRGAAWATTFRGIVLF